MSGSARTRSSPWFGLTLWVALTMTLAFLVLPVLAIFLDTSPAKMVERLGEPQAKQALLLSLETSAAAIAAIVLFGTPAAYLLAMRRFPGRAVVLMLIELPLVLPPAVAGIGLLAALGPQGILGGALAAAHIQLVLQTAGVVVALTFVAAPFYLRAGCAAFDAVDGRYLEASRSLGARETTTFLRIAVPLAGPGLAAGLALAWGRALGEFGATLMFAGSFAGITQTASLAIYDQFATDLPSALAMSAVLVVVSAALLLTIKLLLPRGSAGAGLAWPAQPPM